MRHRIGSFFIIMGAVTGLVVLVSAFNTMFDLNLGIGARGSSKTALPNEWGSVAALAVAAAIFAGIGWLLISERVAKVFRTYRAVRYGVPAALLLIGYFGYYQISYWSYGGKLPWAAAKGDTELVAELLADGDYDEEAINDAWEEAVEERQMKSAALLAAPVLAKGDACQAFSYSTWELELVQMLVDAGGDPSGCYEKDEYDLMYIAILRNGEESAGQIIRLLHSKGVRPGPNALEEAARIKDPAIVSLLQP